MESQPMKQRGIGPLAQNEGEPMSYYYTKKLNMNFTEAVEKVRSSLAEQGFGVLSEIDIQETLKKKLNVDFYKYKILGACNPKKAFAALQEEDKIGVMLPCNVIIQQKEEGLPTEVSVVDPVATMQTVGNDNLTTIAEEVSKMLQACLEDLPS